MAKAKRKTAKGKPKDKIPQPALDQTLTQTWQARLPQVESIFACLDAIGALHGRLERLLFAEIMRRGLHLKPEALLSNVQMRQSRESDGVGEQEKSAEDRTDKAILKDLFCHRYRISSRQFNALWSAVVGKIASVREKRKTDMEALATAIPQRRKNIARIEKRKKESPKQKVRDNARYSLWGKQRKLAICIERLEHLKQDDAQGKIRICFGSKRLFHAQNHLAENGYASLADWKADWQAARSSEFFYIGSKDETAGCGECQITHIANNQISLRVKVPEALVDAFGPFLEIEDIPLPYGFEPLLAAIEECRARKQLQQAGQKDAAKQRGQAISFRFKRDDAGWRVFITTDMKRPTIVTRRSLGVIGADLNADHIAVCETDRFGNPVRWWSIPLVTYGLSRHQAEALIGEAVRELVAAARDAGKPLVIEHLDFKAKKAKLEGESSRYARMLSSFAYGRFLSMLTARAFREGVQLWKVNPAYTSVIGRCNWMSQYGMTVHQAAALVIGRRILRLSEKPRRSIFREPIPDGKNGHVTVDAPARRRQSKKQSTHVWVFWRGVSRRLTAALAARRREEREALLKERERHRTTRPCRATGMRGRRENPSVPGSNVPDAACSGS